MKGLGRKKRDKQHDGSAASDSLQGERKEVNFFTLRPKNNEHSH